MTPIPTSAILILITAAGPAGAGTKRVVFDSHARTREKFSTEYVSTLLHEFPVSVHKWALKNLNADLPSDWSSYKFLVMGVKSSPPAIPAIAMFTPLAAAMGHPN
jgi:hypothetical protein